MTIVVICKWLALGTLVTGRRSGQVGETIGRLRSATVEPQSRRASPSPGFVCERSALGGEDARGL